MQIEYIDQPEQLNELCERILKHTWIALDTEFLREKTYYPEFCLLQIATPEWVVCVDPIALTDLSDLFKVINTPTITKVLHSCRQDLEIFYKLTGEITAPVFDTQIAAPLLGFQDNPGYAMLVSSFLNINLNKAHTRTDWSSRPLSEDQIQYAADDVIYLCKIYQIMCDKLEQHGRLNWLDNDFEQLKKPELYEVIPTNAWLKVKGKNKLTGKQLSIIQALSKWREATSQANNRPKNWLLRDDLMLELAKLQPVTQQQLYDVRGINERTAKRYGNIICQLIADARQTTPIPLQKKNKSDKKSQHQEAVIDVLTAIVRMRAEENSINPSVLATRKNLELLISEETTENPLLQGWRFTMVGKELQGMLQGQYALTLSKTTLFLQPSE